MPNQNKLKPTTRKLNWFLRTYHQPEDIISRLNGLKHFAYILHDKDIKQDGSPDVPHYHIILNFYNQHTASSIQNTIDKVSDLLQKDYNFFLSTIENKPDNCLASKFAYLTHMLDTDKHQYPRTDIVCDDIAYWEQILSNASNDILRAEGNIAFLSDLFELSYIQLAKRYGRDYIKNFRAYNDFKHIVLQETSKENFKSAYDAIKFALDNDL